MAWHRFRRDAQKVIDRQPARVRRTLWIVPRRLPGEGNGYAVVRKSR